MHAPSGPTLASRLADFRSSLLICEDIDKDVAVFAAGRPMLVPAGGAGYRHTLNLLAGITADLEQGP